MTRAVVVCLLGGFVSVLGAYVALTMTGHDASGLVSVVVTLVGLSGLGAHIENRTQQQNNAIAKIDQQTNGVLDRRILDGASAAIAQVLDARGFGSIVPAAPAVPPAPALVVPDPVPVTPTAPVVAAPVTPETSVAP